MLTRIEKLVRAGWRYYVSLMVRRKRGDGSIRTDLLGTMSFMDFGSSKLDENPQRMKSPAPSPSSRAVKEERGAVLARIVNAAAATRSGDGMEDVSDLTDEEFIRRMAR